MHRAISYLLAWSRGAADRVCLSRSPFEPFSQSGYVYMSDNLYYGFSLEGITGMPSSVPLPLSRSSDDSPRISLFLGNSLYLAAFSYYVIIFFLGYNGMHLFLFLMVFPLSSLGAGKKADSTDLPALPFLQHTELLLSPIILYAILWAASLFGFNIPKHIAPWMTLGGR